MPALSFGRATAALQLLKVGVEPVEIGPHLLDPGVQLAALRGLAAAEQEEARAFTPGPPCLRGGTLELGLLGLERLFVAPELFAARIAAAVEIGELRFQPAAYRVLRLLAGRHAGLSRRHRLRVGASRQGREEKDGRPDGSQRSYAHDQGQNGFQRPRKTARPARIKPVKLDQSVNHGGRLGTTARSTQYPGYHGHILAHHRQVTGVPPRAGSR